MSKNRLGHIPVFDRMRALAILIIVFHHLPAYTFNYYNLSFLGLDLSVVNDLNRYFALGIFTFMSGYLLEYNYPFLKTGTEIRQFLVKRYVRIFPLYAISVLLFILLFRQFIDFNLCTLAINFLGLQIVLAKGPCQAIMTLWYIGLVFTYYYLFIIIKKFCDHFKYFFIVLCALSAVIIGLKLFLGFGDKRLLLYLPIFVSGILVRRYKILEQASARYYALTAIFFFVCCIYYGIWLYPQVYEQFAKPPLFSFISGEVFVFSNLIMIFFTFSIYGFMSLFDANEISRITRILSYSSYTIYLFHRPIWWLMIKLCHQYKGYLRLAFMILLVIPLTAIVSYYVQHFYDRYCVRWLTSKLIKNQKKCPVEASVPHI